MAIIAVVTIFGLLPTAVFAGGLPLSRGVLPAAVGGRLGLGPTPTPWPSAQPDSWAVGVHAINATPNPAVVQGVQMTAVLPATPSGLTSTAGPYYMLVLSVIFPNGRFVQIDVRTSPAGTDGCLLSPCSQSVYDIAKFPGGVSASSIQYEVEGLMYRLAIWRDASSGKWRYGIASSGGLTWVVERNDFLSNLNPNFGDADPSTFIRVDQADEWFGNGSLLQEFVALESYDWSSSDWTRIGTLAFGPAVSFFQGNGSSAWPNFVASRGALACSTQATCQDPDGRAYFGFIGCCNGVPTFVSIAGLFQGSASTNAFLAGDSGSPGAGKGDVLWADLPSVPGLAFLPDAIRGGNGTVLSISVLNPNGFSLRLGFRRQIRSTTTGLTLSDSTPDLGPLTLPAGRTTEPQSLATSATTVQDFYNVQVEIWSAAPGVPPASVLGVTGWSLRALVVDDEPPTAVATLLGTRGRGTWYVSTVSVGIAGTDPLSGIGSTWYRLDGTNASAFVAYAPPVTVSEDGSHSLDFFVIDRAGNVGAASTIAFAIDDIPPSLTIRSPVDETGFANGTFRVTWAGEDNGSGIEHYSIQLGDGSPLNVSGSLSHQFAGIPNGTYTVRVRADDWAGNEATRMVTVRIGTVPPSLGPWVALGAVLAGGATGAIVFLVARGRSRKRAESTRKRDPGTVSGPKQP